MQNHVVIRQQLPVGLPCAACLPIACHVCDMANVIFSHTHKHTHASHTHAYKHTHTHTHTHTYTHMHARTHARIHTLRLCMRTFVGSTLVDALLGAGLLVASTQGSQMRQAPCGSSPSGPLLAQTTITLSWGCCLSCLCRQTTITLTSGCCLCCLCRQSTGQNVHLAVPESSGHGGLPVSL